MSRYTCQRSCETTTPIENRFMSRNFTTLNCDCLKSQGFEPGTSVMLFNDAGQNYKKVYGPERAFVVWKNLDVLPELYLSASSAESRVF